jgi:hypothetical protein
MNCLTNRWLKKCVQLTIVNDNENEDLFSFVIDDTLVRFFCNYSIKLCNLIKFLTIQDTGPEIG